MQKTRISIYLVMVLFLFSCKKTETVEKNIQQPCYIDTLNVTYNNQIAPILNTDCNRCHKTGNTSGYVNLDSYINAKPFGINGNLYGCVQRLDGNVGMPIGAPKLDSLKLLLIKRWCLLQCPEN